MCRYSIVLFLILLLSCNNSSEKNSTVHQHENELDSIRYPELLTKSLEAHGGLDNWKAKMTLTYDLNSGNENSIEHHIINLQNRKVLIKSDSFKIGWDGNEAWASPNIAATKMKSPRFYHNLFFYFFSMPFVLSDPGINYEDLGVRTINDKKYRALKISYKEGVGDADNDVYIAHFDPDTFILELLLYTVTYYSGEKHDNYNALFYSEYETIDNIKVPLNLKGHKYNDGVIGDLRYNIQFRNVQFSGDLPDQSIFEIPKNAEVDSLITY